MNEDYDPLTYNITVKEMDKDGFPTKFEILSFDTLQNSVVEITQIKKAKYEKELFKIPKDTQCTPHDKLINI